VPEPSKPEPSKIVTACLLVIGNEILSGRTRDSNMHFIAGRLTELGIRLMEARVVPDIAATIVATLNEVRSKYDYVFTTGGIGPTHDDITADCVAEAFSLPIGPHPEAVRRMTAHYQRLGTEFNQARRRMARTPEGATLIDNPVSTAPGFQIGNVYVMAGIPQVMQAMFDGLKHRLIGGAPVMSRAVSGFLPEGVIAAGLGALQGRYPDIEIGSYPFQRQGRAGSTIVLRGTDRARLDAATEEYRALHRQLGGDPIDGETTG
jgi:molybdenum cofactor synthesis domain-containing protein